jgi:hypothetical protein
LVKIWLIFGSLNSLPWGFSRVQYCVRPAVALGFWPLGGNQKCEFLESWRYGSRTAAAHKRPDDSAVQVIAA